jgi:hypothetical protein
MKAWLNMLGFIVAVTELQEVSVKYFAGFACTAFFVGCGFPGASFMAPILDAILLISSGSFQYLSMTPAAITGTFPFLRRRNVYYACLVSTVSR